MAEMPKIKIELGENLQAALDRFSGVVQFANAVIDLCDQYEDYAASVDPKLVGTVAVPVSAIRNLQRQYQMVQEEPTVEPSVTKVETSPGSHLTKITPIQQPDGAVFRAQCSCGWRDALRADPKTSEVARRAHMAEAGKAPL